MKTVKSFSGWVGVALICAAGTLPAAEPGTVAVGRVLEQVVVTAKAPAVRAMEEVVVVARRPATSKASTTAEAPIEVALAVEAPRIELSATLTEIEAALPTLSL